MNNEITTQKSSGRKKFFFWFTGAVLFFSIVAVFVFFLFRPDKPSPSVVFSDLCPLADYREEFSCFETFFIPAVIAKQDPRLCDQLPSAELRDTCRARYIANQTIAKQDPRLCDQLPSAELRDECRDQYIASQAIAKQDPAACDQLARAEFRDECRDQFIVIRALASHDIARCDDAVDPALCRMFYSVNQALRQRDADACNEIADTKRQSKCKEIVKAAFSPLFFPERK